MDILEVEEDTAAAAVVTEAELVEIACPIWAPVFTSKTGVCKLLFVTFTRH
jgi:hypothetical protein